YAATEAPMMQWFVDDGGRTEDPRIPIGYPLPGNRLAIVDDAGRPAAAGEVGELVVASPYVALGLWTDGRCVPGGFEATAGGRLLRTGDLVRQRPDGLLERLGRNDQQVKIRGVRVELDGVEAALRQHPRVRDVGALARTSGADGGLTLVAYVSAKGAPAGLVKALKDLMRGQPAAMRPARIYLVPQVPRLPSSKLDVRALTALDAARARAEQPAAEADRAEPDRLARTVAQVWRNVLQAPEPGPEADFFDVGGDSLKAVTLMIELEATLGLELPLTLIHEAPTFGGLCEALRAQAMGYTPLVPLKAGDGLPPVFFVHGVGGSVADLFPIARAMTYPGAVIGIQARGLDGKTPPHATVEAMAAEYLAAIKARQPEGPYYLCGYSFGGLVAFEMARRLSEAGDAVGLVGLFDTVTSPLAWPLPAWLTFVRRRLARLAARLLGNRPDAQRDLLSSAPANVLKVAASGLLASARYRPGFYAGDLTLFVPVGRDPALPRPEAIWRGHAAGLAVVDTAGGHLTMLAKPNAETAAASLTRRLPAG
ncbi:MAG: alpha/beta fold hydrolase, partial [Phenylobacterium sp.]